MTALSHDPSNRTPETARGLRLILVREMWAALAIVAVWLAVLFTAVFGPDIVTHDVSGSGATIPFGGRRGLLRVSRYVGDRKAGVRPARRTSRLARSPRVDRDVTKIV
jgi:hypothetical protein